MPTNCGPSSKSGTAESSLWTQKDRRQLSAVFSVSRNLDTLLKNASIFERRCSPPRAAFGQWAKGHTCGLSSVFSEAHVLRKNRFPLCFAACGRQNSAEGFFLYKKRFPSCVDFTFFDRLKTADSCLRSLSVVTPQRCRGRWPQNSGRAAAPTGPGPAHTARPPCPGSRPGCRRRRCGCPP